MLRYSFNAGHLGFSYTEGGEAKSFHLFKGEGHKKFYPD